MQCKWNIYWILILNVLMGSVFALIQPPWQGYDEPQHYLIIKFVSMGYDNPFFRGDGWWNVPPDLKDEWESKIVKSMVKHRFWEIHNAVPPMEKLSFKMIFKGAMEFMQPPLFYSIAAVFMKILPQKDLVNSLYWLRFLSVIISTFTVIIYYKWISILVPRNINLKALYMLFIILNPMHCLLTSTINNDVLTELLGALLILILTRMFLEPEFKTGLLILSVLISAVGMLTKATFSIAVILIPMTLALKYVHRDQLHLRLLLRLLSAVGICAAIVSSIVFHFADLFNTDSILRLPILLIHSGTDWIMRINVDAIIKFFSYLFKSSAGVLVYGHEFLPQYLYWFQLLLLICTIIGFFLAVNNDSVFQKKNNFSYFLFLVISMFMIQTFVKFMAFDKYWGHAHYRYLLISHGCITFVVAVGWWKMLVRWINDSSLLFVTANILLIYQIYFIICFVFPKYYL